MQRISPASCRRESNVILITCYPVFQQIPFQMEVIKSSTDSDSIGSVICERADKINAAVSTAYFIN